MADSALIERLAGGVFDPPVAFRDLATYHLDFAMLADSTPEADLRERAERQSGCCAVIGASGSGKSSLIAAVAASLSSTRFPVRVQGVSDDAALTREGFALHTARETLRALESPPAGRPRRHGRRRGLAGAAGAPGAGAATHAARPPVPKPAITAEFKAQMSASAREVIEERDTVSVAQAIEQLVDVSAELGRRILLVVEDTDVFMPPDPLDRSEDDRPRRFADHVISYLARDFPASSLVAINARYRELIPPSTVATVAVPSLRPEAIGRLIEHYALRSGLHVTAEQVAEPEALAYAAGRYAETLDIRRTLELLHKAARKMAGEGRGDRITVEVLHGL